MNSHFVPQMSYVVDPRNDRVLRLSQFLPKLLIRILLTVTPEFHQIIFSYIYFISILGMVENFTNIRNKLGSKSHYFY